MGDAKRRIESGLMVLAKPPIESKIMVIENIKDGVNEITNLAEGMRDRHSRGFILFFTQRSPDSKAVQTETATTRIDEIAKVLGC